jgi:hypothetical protein
MCAILSYLVLGFVLLDYFYTKVHTESSILAKIMTGGKSWQYGCDFGIIRVKGGANSTLYFIYL